MQQKSENLRSSQRITSEEKELNQILNEKPIDREKLREIGRKTGFINDFYRAKAWPALISFKINKQISFKPWSCNLITIST